MTPQEVYKRFLLKVNKNDTNANIKVSKGVFVLLFNEQKREWLETTIHQDEDSDYIEGIEELLEIDVPLQKLTENTRKADFLLPQNFYRRCTSYSIASRDTCKDQVLVNWFVKSKNVEVLLQNSDQAPSFDYRETLALLNKDRLSVYTDNFNVDKVYLSYYREPLDLDIAGYTKIDGTASSDITIDLSDVNVEEIINHTALEAVRNYESITQTQLAAQRQ